MIHWPWFGTPDGHYAATFIQIWAIKTKYKNNIDIL
jgi:hypothetical protein